MKALLTTTIFWLTVLTASAQYTFVKQWDYRYGGDEHEGLIAFTETLDSGFLLGGTSYSGISGDKTEANRGDSDYWIVKLNADGIKQWDRTFGSLGGDGLQGLAVAKDGGYLVGGNTYWGIGGDKTEASRGGYDYWVVKINASGVKEWDKTFGGPSGEYGPIILSCKDGGYLLSGNSWSGMGGDKTEPSWGDYDLWVVKIDSAELKQWDKRFGGTDRELGTWTAEKNDGGYIIIGSTQSDSSGDVSENNRGAWDYWVINIDADGNKIWEKRYGGTGGDSPTSVIVNNSDDFILAGNSSSPISGDKTQIAKGNTDYWVVKIDSTGQKELDKVYGGTNAEELWNMVKTKDGGHLLSGTSTSNIGADKSEYNNDGEMRVWVLKVDSLRNKQWDKTIFTVGGILDGGYAIQTTDGCYAVGEITSSGIGGYKSQPNWDASNQTADYWVLKFCMEPYNAIEEPQAHKGDLIQVWPNPFSSDISIALTNQQIQEATFTITDATGRVVYQKEENNLAPGYTKVLDLSWLANGVYFVTVSTANSGVNSQVKRVVKQ